MDPNNAQAPMDVDKILSTIRQVESNNDYSIRSKGSSASGAYQFIDDTWKRYTQRYGVGTEYPSARQAPPEVQDQVARLKVQEILGQVGGDVSKVPLVWYTGNPQGRMTEEAVKANQGQTADKYQQKWLSVFNRGDTTKVAAPTPAPATRTTVQAKAAPAQVKAAPAQVTAAINPADLPTNYTSALALSYISDTDPEGNLMSRVNEMMEEIQGGQARPPGGAALQQFAKTERVDPFKLMAQAQAEEEKPKRAVPRMPVMMANGGLAQRAMIANRPRMTSADYTKLTGIQKDFANYNRQVEDYQKAIDAYNAKVEAYNAAGGEGVEYPGEFTTAEPATPSTTPEQAEALQKEAQARAGRFYAARNAALQNVVNPGKYNLAGMSFSFANGGEVDLEQQQNELSATQDRDEYRKKSQEMLYNLRTNLGPVMGQFVPGREGVDVRASTQIGAVRPFVDISPNELAVTRYGASYGRMGPQGGYEVAVEQPTPMPTPMGPVNLPPSMRGVYAQPLGRDGTLAVQGMYSPGPNPQYRVGVNLTKRFEHGGLVHRQFGSPEQGEVANPADIAEQMTVGTLPTDQKPAGQVFRDIGRDVVRGAQYLPYDLLGAPVDIATMAMRPFGYNVEKPFLGSEYLIDKAAQAGIADRPTGSLAETTSRIGMGFVNPASVARQIPKGIAAVERGAETLGTGAVRAITGKPDITPEQIYQAMAEPKGIMQLGAPAIVKPKGGTFVSGESSNFDQALNAMGDSLQGRRREYGYVQDGEEVIKQIDEIDNFFKSKFKNYYQKKLGSQNDPLREAFIRGDFNGSDWFNAEDIARLREVATDPTNVGSVTRKQALDELNRKYDAWTDITAIFPTEELKKAGGWLEASSEYQKRMVGRLQDQGTKVGQRDLAFSIEDRPLGDIDPRAINAFKENDLPYDVSSTATLQDRMVSIRDYLMTLNPNQIKNITFEDAIIGAERYHDALKNPAKKFTPAQLFEGREKLFQPSEKYQWSEIKTEDALRREGDAMNHCIGGDEYCRQLTSGIGRHFSLQDAETGIPHTTISIYRSPFAPPNAKHVVVEQIKGNSNSAPTKYFNEVEKFLEDYEKRVGKIYITEDKRHIPPAFKGPEYTELPRGYEGNQYAKGGMVDKPLYDRAA